MQTHRIISMTMGVMLSAGAAMACAPGDDLRATLAFADLTAAEQDGFARLFVPEQAVLTAENIAIDDAFGFDRCDLGGMGGDTLITFALPGVFCEENCLLWALHRTEEDDWQIILAAEGTVSIAGSYSMGWPDLVAHGEGFADIVHKFDGASYHDELEGLIYGEVFDLPQATSWQADEFDFVGVVPGSPGPRGESVIALQAVAQQLGISIDGLSAGLTDLNGDETPEVIVQGEGAEFCAADGCRTWIVSIAAPNATILADVTAQGTPEIAASTNGAYRDIIIWSNAGARVLRHDGSTYR